MILRKAYGGAYIAMCNKELGSDMVLAWPSAQIAVMGAEGAVNIMSSVRAELKQVEDDDEREALRKQRIDEYEELFNNPYYAAGLGYVDDVIEPATARQRIASALDMLKTKKETLPPKKHGDIPL
jgi:acetyl-CoA carboxylase carboxyltransferase component